jgi:hypothetical protein
VTGVTDGETLVQRLHELLAREMTPSPLFSVSLVQASGEPVVVVDVPRGADKPYSLNREIWVRVGSSTLQATADQSVELVRRAAHGLDSALYYVVGPPGMVAATREALRRREIREDDVRTEELYGY